MSNQKAIFSLGSNDEHEVVLRMEDKTDGSCITVVVDVAQALQIATGIMSLAMVTAHARGMPLADATKLLDMALNARLAEVAAAVQ